MLENIITWGILLAALAWYFSGRKKPPKNLDELINYKVIHPNGIIELSDYRYRMMLELEPINMDQMSMTERAAVWVGFRDYMNCLMMPVTHIIQSRKLDLKNYFAEIKKNNENRTPELKEFAEDYAEFYSTRSERNRDHKYYLILSFNALELASIESGIKVDNAFINNFTKNLKKKADPKMSPDEYQTLAFNELDDQASVIEYTLGAIEINVKRMNKVDVADFLNHTLNRDLAPICTVWEADQYKMFSGLVNYSFTRESAERLLRDYVGEEAAAANE